MSDSLRKLPKLWLLAVLCTASCLAGCSRAPEPVAAPVSRPVPLLTVEGAAVTSALRFPGRVRATQRAELAFNVPGQIVAFPATEGARMDAGQLIARLDSGAYDTALGSAQASYDKARTDYERLAQIWENSQAVARAEVDRARTDMDVARSAYAAARRDLQDTELRAPFSGILVRRHVENFQNVRAKEPVVSLQDLQELEIVIHVPERVMRAQAKQLIAYAQFEDIPERRFAVALQSYAAEADPQTQTYEVVLKLSPPEDVKILPGMSVEVIPGSDGMQSGIAIPLQAVSGNTEGKALVWVYDQEQRRITAREVNTGPITGDSIVITSGLQPGERIATAGLSQLRDGMRVHPLE